MERIFPEDFVARLNLQKGAKYTDKLLEALNKPAATSIRVNPDKKLNIDRGAEKVPWSQYGYFLSERPKFTLDPHLHAGAYYVQESSSMFLEEVFRQVINISGDFKVLDLCGAPGGKATHLATLIGGNGLLVTNEVIRQRAAVLAENISKWGTGNVLVTSNDPTRFASLPGFFDLMVIDAPCSGEGMFRNDTAVEEWSTSNTNLCSDRQRRILMDAWPALKNNGLLIYSTCTFNPAENEENMTWLAEQEGVESLQIKLNPIWGIEEVVYKGIYGYYLIPGKVNGEGFFISVCRKPDIKQEKIVLPSRKKEDSDRLGISIVDRFTVFDNPSVFRINDLVGVAATDLNTLSLLQQKLTIVKAGTAVATIKGKDTIPHHELALSVNFRKEAFPVVKLSYADAINFLRREQIKPLLGEKGWSIIEYDNSRLGFLKNLGSRYNNYYPTDWRIRMTP